MEKIAKYLAVTGVLVLLMAFTCFAQGWEQVNGDWYYYDENHQMLINTTTPDGYKVDADGKWIQESTVPSLEKAFGMEGKQLVAHPSKDSDHFFNAAFSFMKGNWEYVESIPKGTRWIKDTLYPSSIYGDILGAFLNQNPYQVIWDGKQYKICTNGITPYFSKEELMNQQTAAYNKAKEIHEYMHSSKRVHDGMSQFEVCKAYYDYYPEMYHSSASTEPELADSSDPVARTHIMKYDTAYAKLVNGQGGCGPTTSAFNLLLHLEGIKSYGVNGVIVGTPYGHVLNYVILDGKEYYVDFLNRQPMFAIDSDKAKNWFAVEPQFLQYAREASKY